MWQLILFRGIQGIGAGSLFPISLAVIGDLFTPAERGKYQGLFGAVFGLAALVGPALGGIITDNVGWHWIFYINLPIGLVSLLVVSRVLPSVKRPKHSLDLDLAGALVFVAAMIPLLVGLTNKQSADWATPEVGGLLLIAAVLIPVFLFIESRVKQPIVPLDLWRSRTYAGSHDRDVLRGLRLLLGDDLPAALLPGGAGRQRDDLRLRALPAPRGRHRLEHRERPDRGPDGQVQGPPSRVGRAGRDRVSPVHEPCRDVRPLGDPRLAVRPRVRASARRWPSSRS